MSECSRYERLLPLLPYGELSPEEQKSVEEHVARCQRCAVQLEELTAVLRLADGASRYQPSDVLLARSRARVQVRLRQPRPPGRLASARRWLEGVHFVRPQLAGAVALLFAGFLAGHYSWPLGVPPSYGPGQPATFSGETLPLPGVDAEITSIRFSPETGVVQIRYVTRAPVTLRGRPQDAAIRQVLARALRQEDPALRLRAARALSFQPSLDQEVIDALLQALKTDTTLGVRLKVIKALRQISSLPRVRDALIWTMLHDESAVVRMETIDALSSVEEPAGLEPIFQRSARRDTDVAVRVRAQRAIRRLENPKLPAGP